VALAFHQSRTTTRLVGADHSHATAVAAGRASKRKKTRAARATRAFVLQQLREERPVDACPSDAREIHGAPTREGEERTALAVVGQGVSLASKTGLVP
jgi:hypothetical protein